MSSTNIAAEGTPARTGIPRAVEAAVAGLGCVVCLPVLGVMALGVRASSPGPVLFRQRRVGRGGVEFTLLKFRTMRINSEAMQVTAKGDRRITRLGRWLRKLKLDELPELWNVVRGDMSLVGPRPEVPRYVDLANPLWRAVLLARPGITDPVTLRLRNEEELMAAEAGDRERFYLETLQPYKLVGYLHYLQHRSFLSDVGVILRTVLAVLVPAVASPPPLEEIREIAATAAAASSLGGSAQSS
ncbi:MAG: sugar transferase [Thermoanaerobaculaceae bacterium]|jgi:lipopolysaccharide/colanic/teichoic acid biosynthesis glycosyltransferase